MTNASPSLPWDGQPYSVKRHGVSITNCDSEPVQTPGCVQSHGALLVLRLTDLTVLQASENAETLLGRSADGLLGQSIAEVVGDQGAERLRQTLTSEPTGDNPLYVFTLPARGEAPPLDVTVHTSQGAAIVEFEATGRTAADSPDFYTLVKNSTARLQTAGTLREFCQTVAEVVRGLTGFDRVMVYKFHADHSGEVFAESKLDELPPWLGQHYPAEDIPKPAREVFKQTWVRPVPDVNAGLAELRPLVNPDSGRPLTMTYCALRGASVMYTEYLQNMHVTAALTLSLRQHNDLWGLIACHHYSGPKPIPYQVRAACELFAQVASLQHKAAEEREHLLYRLRLDTVHQELVARAAREGDLASALHGQSSLLDGISAGGAALYRQRCWETIGATPSDGQLDQLAAWLYTRPEFQSPTRPLYATDSLSREFPPAAEYVEVASGVLAVPLSRTNRALLIWFRPETIQTITWSGNPHDKPTIVGPHGPRLTPRASFELWRESVRAKALPWYSFEIEAASQLRIMAMEFVVGRAEHLADLNTELARSNEELDAFAYVASHDLKEPLRGIFKYAHQLQEYLAETTTSESGERHAEQQRKLEGLMRLTVRMDSLLDSLLHFSRVGRVALAHDENDLNEVLAEAWDMIGSRRTGETEELVIPRPLPMTTCDRVRCREIYVNLLSNALKYNDKPRKRVEVGYIDPHEPYPHGARPSEAGVDRIFYVKDNGIGIHDKHFTQIFKMFKRLHGREEFGGGTGVGLTIVKKLVERHHGRIWISSTLGEGTTVYFTLPCEQGT